MQERVNVVEVGCDTQLLLDNHVVDDVWNIRRSPEIPVKYTGNPIIQSCRGIGECSAVAQSVMYDEEEKIFKLWYTIMDRNADTMPEERLKGRSFHYQYRGAYAVSNDGLEWEFPSLGLVDYRGSSDNNIVMEEGCGYVLKDLHETDPERRYKMLTKRRAKRGGRAFAAFSRDGIRWNDYAADRSVIKNSRDGGLSFIYDPRIGKYVLFTRPTVLPLDIRYDPDELGFPDRDVYLDDFYTDDRDEFRDISKKPRFPAEDDFVNRWETEDYIHRYLKVFPYMQTRSLRISQGRNRRIGCNRRIARAQSEDFINWTEPAVVIQPDELDPPRLYNMDVTLYHGVYIGLLQVFYSWGHRRRPGTPDEPETFELQLAFSRDGIRWERLANRPVFLQRGYVGDFDGGIILGTQQPIIPYGDELRIYYTGSPTCHNGSPFTGFKSMGVGVARLQKERLIARSAGDELGVLMTKPFVVEGDALEVNADARRGLLKVEAVHPDGERMEGFSCNEASEIRENGYSIPVTWKSGSRIGDLKGRMVRLRIYMRDARLYAFRFLADK